MITEQKRFDALRQTLTINEKMMHVGLLLKRASDNWPDNIAVLCDNNKITYRELYSRAQHMAQRLIALGVKPNDRVLIYYENSIEFFVAYYAVWHMGALVAPLNVFLQQAELVHIIKDSKPALIIVSESLKPKLADIENLPPLLTDIDLTSTLDTSINIEIADRNIDDTSALLYTSGTTGFPKAVMLSSKNIITNTIQGISRFETSHQERIYCALPLFHSLPQNTCLWSNVVLGSLAIIVPKIERHSLIRGLEHKPTIIIGVPALYGLFCRMKTLKFGKVRYFFCGGDALSDKIRAYFELLYRRKLCNGYGLTETSPFVCVDSDDYTQDTNTIGKPFIGIEISIRDDKGNELPHGQIGVLWIKGDNVMKGYYNAPEATHAVLQNGWFNSGDLAYIDKNGKIVLAGREKDVIKHKGVNIFPQEIENVLLSHASVTQAGVIGVKDNDEEYPVAYVASIEKDHTQLAKELRELCQRNLAMYKVPRQFIIKKELPVTATGKVDKKKLRAEYSAPK